MKKTILSLALFTLLTSCIELTSITTNVEPVSSSNKQISPSISSSGFTNLPVPNDNILPNTFSTQTERVKNDFSEIDNKILNIPSEKQVSIDSLSSYIKEIASTDTDKTRAIYKWITNNINYDVNCFFNNNCPSMAPEEVFSRKSGVCQGYSELFKKLASNLGLTCTIIGGYAGGCIEKGESCHAWNGVKIDGNWYLVDSTWGAGYVDFDKKTFTRSPHDGYFLIPPAEMIYDHLPENKEWQLLENTLSREDVANFPKTYPNFFIQGFKLDSHKQKKISINDSQLTITLDNKNEVPLLLSSLKKDNKELKNCVLIEQENEKININLRFPEQGSYTFSLFSKDKSSSKSDYDDILEYQVITTKGEQKFFPKIYYTESTTQLIYPKEGTIESGKREFKIKIKTDSKLYIINNENKWTEMTKESGDIFYGSADITKGLTSIAIENSDNKYLTLVEYNTI